MGCLDFEASQCQVTAADCRQLRLSTFHARRQWVYPIKSYLKAGETNSLAISIKSAFKTSLANKEAYPYHIPTLYVSSECGSG